MPTLCVCEGRKAHVHLRRVKPGEFALNPPRVPMCACGHGHKAGPDGESEPCQECNCPGWREPADAGKEGCHG